MKSRNLFLLFLLLVLVYFSLIEPSFIIKPFYYIKDIIFSSVHAITPSVSFSKDLESGIISSLKEDLLELAKLNNINLSLNDFNMINATVISRNKEYWFNTLTINKGSSDGVELDMAVIDQNGLIGRINTVTSKTSTIKLITTNDVKNKVSAVINNNKDKVYGIINGYDSVNNYLNLVITDNIEIEKDSIVETTGMGGVFPSGILIGKVHDLIKLDDGITKVVRVIPSSNIKGERYVSVLQRKEISFN